MLALLTGLLAAALLYPLVVQRLFALQRRLPPPRWRRVALVVTALGTIYPTLLLGLSLQQRLVPQRGGPLALAHVLAPFLFLPLALLAPLALLRGTLALRLALAACLVVAGVRFAPPLRLQAPDAAPDAPRVTVLNWNVGRHWRPGPAPSSAEAAQAARVRPVLAGRPADVVVLEEAYWGWLRRDPDVARHYPHQQAHTPQASSGLVLLSAFPFLARGVAEVPREERGWPRVVWARLDFGAGRTLLVVAAHPEAPAPELWYDPAARDALIPHIRAFVDPALARGEPTLLVGDLNVTAREPAYRDLARGLQDVHQHAGRGPGLTWGLDPDLGWRWPLLRIDHMLAGPGVLPLASAVDCTPRGSDHCIVRGRFALP
jgi:vancomycin resistance protein VanJ